jgi:O-antigen/teichoic acid export membrane protein
MFVCIILGPVLSSYTFSWGDHTLHFVLLAPAVALMAVTGGETAILKGVRQLRSLAGIQICNVFLALFVTIPLYYFFGETAIVPVIVLMALIAMLLTLHKSFGLYPLSLTDIKKSFDDGMPMVRLGVAFVMAGILGSGAEMLIRSYLNVTGDLQEVGLYNAGYMLMVTYAGMAFSAMETDFFPRLSAVSRLRTTMSETVNRQIEVSLLMVSPMLCLLIVGMPYIIPLLFSSEFQPVVGMAQVAVFSMYIKALSLPISYTTLARGDSVAYMVTEAVDDVLLVVFIIYGYRWWGLWGTGVALTASYVVDFIIIYVYTYVRYGYRISFPVVQYASLQFPLGVAAYVVVTFVDNPYVYWLLNVIFCFLSLSISVSVLRQKTSLWSALKRKVREKMFREE